jgi:hypothetical protein
MPFNHIWMHCVCYVLLYAERQLLLSAASTVSLFRIARTLAVPGDFDGRGLPLSRTYVYRLAVPKPHAQQSPTPPGRQTSNIHQLFFPIAQL